MGLTKKTIVINISYKGQRGVGNLTDGNQVSLCFSHRSAGQLHPLKQTKRTASQSN